MSVRVPFLNPLSVSSALFVSMPLPPPPPRISLPLSFPSLSLRPAIVASTYRSSTDPGQKGKLRNLGTYLLQFLMVQIVQLVDVDGHPD